MNTTTRIGTALLLLALVAATLAVPPGRATGRVPAMRTVHIAYRSTTGRTSRATVLLPASVTRPLPLVISPHGRGLDGDANARLWGDLPARGGFAVVNPDGSGEHLSGRFSWGAPHDIDDLARMPQIVERALGVRIDPHAVYAVGGSMGAQETLLLVARHPRLLAGAVAVDAPADFGRQYGNLGAPLQKLARREIGGTPQTAPAAFAARSALAEAAAIAGSGVPLEIWWSRTDEVVRDSQLQSGLLVERIEQIAPEAPLQVVTGEWKHTHPLRYDRSLPEMLTGIGLLAS